MSADLEHIPGPNNNELESSRTILNWQKIYYEAGLRQNYWCDIAIEAEGAAEKSQFKEDDVLRLTRRDTGEVITFYVDRRENVQGLVRIMGRGTVDKDLIRPDSPNYRSSDWTSLDTQGIAGDLVDLQPSVGLNVIDNRSIDSFKGHDSENPKATIERLMDRTDQIFRRDHENDELEIMNPPTTATATLNEDIEIDAVKEETDNSDTPAKVKVIGKSEGEAQVRGSYGPNYSQGDNVETIVDKTVESDGEAEELAENVYNRLQESDSYSFDLIDNGVDFELGDIVTISAGSVNVNNQDLRIVKERRTLQPEQNETVELEVRNVARRKGLPGQDEELAETNSSNRNANSFEQGDIFSITYTDKDMASTSQHANGTFTLPAWVESSDQIIAAELETTRVSKKYGVPGETDDEFTNAGITNQGSFSNTGVNNGTALFSIDVEEAETTLQDSDYQDGNTEGWQEVIADIDPSNDAEGIFFEISMATTTTESPGLAFVIRQLGLRIQSSNGGEYPKLNGLTTFQTYSESNDSSAYDYDSDTVTIYVPENPATATYDLEIYPINYEVSARFNVTWYSTDHLNDNDIDDSEHINPNDFDDNQHANPINRGVNTVSESAKDFSYSVNGSAAATISTAMGVGDSNQADITDLINDPANTRKNEVEVWPDSGDAAVYNVVTIKAYRGN